MEADSFSHTNETTVTDTASASANYLEIVGGDLVGPFLRSATVNARLEETPG